MADIVVSGVVQQVREDGVKLNDRWLGIRKSERGTYPLPAQGAAVVCAAHTWHSPDGKLLTFLDSWEPDATAPAPAPAETPRAQASDRETTITRLACQRDAVSTVSAWLSQFVPQPMAATESGDPYVPLREIEEMVQHLASHYFLFATTGLPAFSARPVVEPDATLVE